PQHVAPSALPTRRSSDLVRDVGPAADHRRGCCPLKIPRLLRGTVRRTFPRTLFLQLLVDSQSFIGVLDPAHATIRKAELVIIVRSEERRIGKACRADRAR